MIRRELYLKKLEMYVDRNIVKIITGVRRCGKTVLMKQFIGLLRENGVPEECIFYVDLEGLIYSYINKTDDLRVILHTFLESCGGKHCYIFIDEADDQITFKFRVNKPYKDIDILFKIGDAVIRKIHKNAIIPSEMEVIKIEKNKFVDCFDELTIEIKE